MAPRRTSSAKAARSKKEEKIAHVKRKPPHRARRDFEPRRRSIASHTQKERHDDTDSSKRAASVELTFDEDPIINKILSDLHHDYLSKSSKDGDVSSSLQASCDDKKMLLEAASTGAAFKVLVNDTAEFDILPTAFQSSTL